MSHYENNIEGASPATINPAILQKDSSRFDIDPDLEDLGNDADCEGDIDYDYDDAQSPGANVDASTAEPIEIDEPVEVDEKDLENWNNETLKNMETQIGKKEDKIKELNKKVAYHQKNLNHRQAEYEKQYELKKMGQHQLNAILAKRNESERYIADRQTDIINATTEIEDLRKQVAEIEANSRAMYLVYLKDKKSGPKGKSSKKKDDAAQNRPAGYDPNSMEGYDSLSENEAYVKRRNRETPKKNATIACRRCRFKKDGCQFSPGQQRCRPCIRKNGKCLFDDPVFQGRQLPINYLEKLHSAYENLQAQVDEYKKASLYSVWSNNPLSGITGYGPRSPRIAEQNYWRMARGMDPIYGFPGGGNENHFPLALTKEEKKKRERNSKESQSKKRKVDSEGDRSISLGAPLTKRHKPNSNDNRQQETLSVPQSQAGALNHSNEPIVNPPLQAQSQGDQVGFNDTTINQHLSLPQTHGFSITDDQFNYAYNLSLQNEILPLDSRHLPIWPTTSLKTK